MKDTFYVDNFTNYPKPYEDTFVDNVYPNDIGYKFIARQFSEVIGK